MKKTTFLKAIVLSHKTITPWKKGNVRLSTDKEDVEYKKGWNDCIKEIQKNRKKFEKFLSEHLNNSPEEDL